jgi:hypothetical protein
MNLLQSITSVNDDDNEAEMASVESAAWKDTSNYEGQRVQFRVGSGPQGATKKFQEIVQSL